MVALARSNNHAAPNIAALGEQNITLANRALAERMSTLPKSIVALPNFIWRLNLTV